ncbi:helix-turn-helix domain-containing protein [Micromonospora sp. DH15]|nr:helix-turn-helix domain-containing protein [Micromonospora sp. DH15]
MPAYHHGNLRPTLLAAAERSLRQHGAEQLSLRELARAVGVSHAAPRRHFPDRQALLDALAEAGFARLDAELRAALAAAGDDFGPRLHAMAAAYLRFATEDAALLELMFTSKHRPGADHLVAAAAAPVGLMHDLIVQGQAQGVLEAGDAADAATLDDVTARHSVQVGLRSGARGGTALTTMVGDWLVEHGAAAAGAGTDFYAWAATESSRIADLRRLCGEARIDPDRVHTQGYSHDRPAREEAAD